MAIRNMVIQAESAASGRFNPRISNAISFGWRDLLSVSVTRWLALGICTLGFAAPSTALDWRVRPEIQLRETWTDNVLLERSSIKRSDFVTEVTPMIGITGRGSRVQVTFDYHPSVLLYAKESNANNFLNYLNAHGVVEAIERFLYVDARAQISQQAISAFGPQITSSANENRNRTETRVVSMTPYVKGSLGGWATYEARYQVSSTSTEDAAASQGKSRVVSGELASATEFASLGWLADFKNAKYNFRDARDVEAQRVRATLIYHFDPELWFFGRIGREKYDFAVSTRNHSNFGFGMEWAPTARTRFSGEHERRFFGSGYKVSFRHRAPGVSFSLLAARQDTTTSEQLTRNTVGTLFERFSELYSGQFPDAQEREERVRNLLARTGIPAEPIPQAGFLSSTLQLERRLEGTVAFLGQRNMVSLSGFQRTSKDLEAGVGLPPEGSGLQPEVREVGFSMNLNHRIASNLSVSGSGGWQRNRGEGETTSEIRSKRVELGLNRQFSPWTTGLLGIRRVWFDSRSGGTTDYQENAIYAGVSHRF